MTAIVAASRLTFGYAGRPVGHDVSLVVTAGRVLCLLGPNGGGKTTFLKTLLGLQAPLDGQILIDGENAARTTSIERARVLSYVPQAASAVFAFTVADMVLMGATVRLGLFAQPGRADRAAVMDTLERLGIAHLADRPFNEISGGERQLVLIGRALVQQARMIVLDEPTASLDFANQARVLEIIGRLRGDGLAVLFSTHHPDQAFEVADEVVLLRDGRFLAQGPTDEVLTPDTLSALYGTRVEIAAIGARKVCFIGKQGARE